MKKPPKTPPGHLGQAICDFRIPAGLTQMQLADKADIPGGESAISRIEQGHDQLIDPRLIRIALALNTTIDELVHGRGWPEHDVKVEGTRAGATARGAREPGRARSRSETN